MNEDILKILIPVIFTFVGIAISPFIQHFFAKRKTRFEIFEKHGQEILLEYFKAYSDVESMWRHFPFIQSLDKKYSVFEIDQMIWPKMNNFRTYTLILGVFSKKEIRDIVDAIFKNYITLNGSYLSNTLLSTKNSMEKSNNFALDQSTTEKTNLKLIKQLQDEIFKAKGR